MVAPLEDRREGGTEREGGVTPVIFNRLSSVDYSSASVYPYICSYVVSRVSKNKLCNTSYVA